MATAILALLSLSATSADGSTVIVDDDGGRWADAMDLQNGLGMASDGDIVLLFAGSYDGAIIDTIVTLSGNGTRATALEPEGDGLWIVADGAEVYGISVSTDTGGPSSVGIRVTGDGVEVRDCEVSGFGTSVLLEGCSGSVVRDVTCRDAAWGILLANATDCDAIDCTVLPAADASTRYRDPGALRRDDAVRFAAAADQHYGWESMTVPPGDREAVEAWMEDDDVRDLDFVIASMGDWISDTRAPGTWQDTDETWDVVVRENADRQMLPYYWVFGNHDITNYEYMIDGDPVRKEGTGRAISGMNENNYAFMYDNVLFICAAQTTILYTLSGFQREWIAHLVERYPDHATVIMAHQATSETTGAGDNRSSSWTANDYGVHNDITWWRRLFDDNPQIVLYIHGHKEKGHNTTVLDSHADANETWDDDCTFVLVPSDGRGIFIPDQLGWGYVFEISDSGISIDCYDALERTFIEDAALGMPYDRPATGYDVTDSGMEWFSIPKQLLDGQRWTWSNQFVADGYRVDLIGTDLTEQLDNADLEGFDPSTSTNALWYEVRGDERAMNKATGETDGFILINGGQTLEIATSPSNEGMFIEGNVPYNTAIAVPGSEYEMACQVSTAGGNGTIDLLVTIPRDHDLYHCVLRDEIIASNVSVNGTMGWVSARFTVPDDPDAWFVQPKVHFDKGASYVMDAWSLTMVGEGNATRDFGFTLNGWSGRAAGTLGDGEFSSVGLSPDLMRNNLSFECSIGGNRAGMLSLVYERPQLWSDDVTFGIADPAQTAVRIEDRSPFNRLTTVMSFEGARLGLARDAFGSAVFHDKFTYLSRENGTAIDGVYDLARVMATVGVTVSGGGGNRVTGFRTEGTGVGIVLSRTDGNVVRGSILLMCEDVHVACIGSTGNVFSSNILVTGEGADAAPDLGTIGDEVVVIHEDSPDNFWNETLVIGMTDYMLMVREIEDDGGGSQVRHVLLVGIALVVVAIAIADLRTAKR
ncbi:MAG: metallophosphoesterase [Thermoplasmata archaeon]|nr:metallophosphoesterase [Thermoplasmata archaeon]